MDEFLMKPKIDFAFKEIMMNEKAKSLGRLFFVLYFQNVYRTYSAGTTV